MKGVDHLSFGKMTITELAAYLELTEELCPEERKTLLADQRRGVAELLIRFDRRKAAVIREDLRLQKMLVEEKLLWAQGIRLIAGIDEAGRGPLAGPVVAAAVVLPVNSAINNLNDSKQLSPVVRERLFDRIVEEAEAYGIGSASKDEIDRLNIHSATMLAMIRALEKLRLQPEFVLVDGFAISQCPFRQKAIRSGDTLSLSIAAASVLAKVTRDKIMEALHEKYPRYGFNRNMGYGTVEHREALSKYGPCAEHRRSFRLSFD
jgi:ribonuclease HII